MKTYPIHPACAKWPRLSAQDFNELVADIRARGLLNPIWLTAEDEILEGKVRYDACLQAGVEPRFETYTGDDPIGFTISHNKLRRHMTVAQLAFVGEELARLQNGSNQYKKKVGPLASGPTSATGKVAGQLGISTRSIEEARSLKKCAEPNIIEMVRNSRVGLQSAAAYSRNVSREEQREATPKTISERGNKLRSPIKYGLAIQHKNAPVKKFRKNPVISFVKFSPDQLQELNEKLRPFVKRLRVQSKKHLVEFSPYELECIAFELNQILERWANPNTDIPQSIPDLVQLKVGNSE